MSYLVKDKLSDGFLNNKYSSKNYIKEKKTQLFYVAMPPKNHKMSQA